MGNVPLVLWPQDLREGQADELLGCAGVLAWRMAKERTGANPWPAGLGAGMRRPARTKMNMRAKPEVDRREGGNFLRLPKQTVTNPVA